MCSLYFIILIIVSVLIQSLSLFYKKTMKYECDINIAVLYLQDHVSITLDDLYRHFFLLLTCHLIQKEI